MPADTGTPWYRQRWPWLLMLGPAIVVVAGFATLAIAVRTDDGLVVDDYYKRGLAINRTLDRAEAAAADQVGATVDVARDGRVTAAVHARSVLPPVLRMRLVHPTRAGHDHAVELVQGPDGRYRGRIEAYAPGRWRIAIETDAWKLPQAEAVGETLHASLGAAP